MTKVNLKNILTVVRDMIMRNRVAYKDYLGTDENGNKIYDTKLIPVELLPNIPSKLLPKTLATKREVQAVKITADDALSTATNAQTAADNAQATANDAQTTANDAQTTANDAKTTAENAIGADVVKGNYKLRVGEKKYVGYGFAILLNDRVQMNYTDTGIYDESSGSHIHLSGQSVFKSDNTSKKKITITTNADSATSENAIALYRANGQSTSISADGYLLSSDNALKVGRGPTYKKIIRYVNTPEEEYDAATKGYVDEKISDAVDMAISFKPVGESYLTFSSPNIFTLAVNDTTKHWDGTLEYFASDKTWTTWNGTNTLSAVPTAGKYVLYLRGIGNTVITGTNHSNWVLTGTDIKCTGNIENLLDYATVETGEHPTMAPATALKGGCYAYLFSGCTSLIQAPVLPSTTLADYCYSYLFEGCTSLIQAPVLPATMLAKGCYVSMFNGCTSLIQAPVLPATALADYCYASMFEGCTSLIQAPILPATTLASHCYDEMFNHCTSLTQVPELPATTLSIYCYSSMFQGCTSLKLSSTKTNEYTQEYCIPSSGEGETAEYALYNMFASTGGTFTGTPSINKTYYLNSDNMIVRKTETSTLNGYVESMIDSAIKEYADTAEYIIHSSTEGSTKKFKITVDDSGTLSATEIV